MFSFGLHPAVSSSVIPIEVNNRPSNVLCSHERLQSRNDLRIRAAPVTVGSTARPRGNPEGRRGGEATTQWPPPVPESYRQVCYHNRVNHGAQATARLPMRRISLNGGHIHFSTASHKLLCFWWTTGGLSNRKGSWRLPTLTLKLWQLQQRGLFRGYVSRDRAAESRRPRPDQRSAVE